MRLHRLLPTALAALLALAATLAHAQTVAPAPRGPWQDTLDAFAAADRASQPKPGGVLFVGSSSIRLWDGLEQQFDASHQVLKRGFGGSRLADCADLLDKLVLPYAPRLVVVYAGDNDIAAGAKPEDVLVSFQRFVTGVRSALPATDIAFLSIKPSPAREALLPTMHAANALIERWAATQQRVAYLDVYSRMLDAQGRPRRELFAADRLHLNRDGYALWREVIAAHLSAAAAGPPATPTRALSP
ncbi:SGNH/GDSL hydrolase family protein [Aquabacterium sp. J223]|uniref:SGNH/GDSL hydrolase family protein n=1 Tax=Aquabacterium sp. J223 TaxID=2898431 RepID=UPI0021ADF74B|nr:SGNH/GDSL hydrolase family protein [Aquabacterium sp. J223]UUX97208.1 GDSL-type esterase/lipase family protein [Aquabacterium sp. J223]